MKKWIKDEDKLNLFIDGNDGREIKASTIRERSNGRYILNDLISRVVKNLTSTNEAEMRKEAERILISHWKKGGSRTAMAAEQMAETL